MDPRRYMLPDNEHNEDNNEQTHSPLEIARKGGQAQGENNATHAQTTQAAQNQPNTAPNGNEHVSTQPGEKTNA